MVFGQLRLLTAFDPVDWHIHEMLLGFLPAVVTGFLLTAVPNWTGRLPVQGRPLGVLVALWMIGRIAVLFSALIGPVAAGVLDCLFLLAVAGVTANEILAGKNWRNLKLLIPLTVLLFANVLFHAEAFFSGSSDYARRLAVAAAVMLIILIGAGSFRASPATGWRGKAGPFAGGLQQVRRSDHRFQHRGLLCLGGGSAFLLSRPLDAGRWLSASCATSPLGRRPQLARASGSRPASVLPLPARGLHSRGPCSSYPVHRFVCRWTACVWRGRHRHNDIGSHDAGVAWPHGACAGNVATFPAVYACAAAAALTRIAATFDDADFETLVALSGLMWAIAFIGFATAFAPKLFRPSGHRKPGR